MIRKLESLEVKDGKIIIKVRAKPDASTSDSKTARRKSSDRGRGSRRTGSPRPNREKAEPVEARSAAPQNPAAPAPTSEPKQRAGSSAPSSEREETRLIRLMSNSARICLCRHVTRWAWRSACASSRPASTHPGRSRRSRGSPNTGWITACASSCSPIRRGPRSPST